MNVYSDPYKQYHFLKECNENFQMQYVNCFNKIRFLAEVSTKLQKMHFLYNLRTMTQEENMKTREMTSFFSCTFSALNICNTHFAIWKYSKFLFMRSPLWSILVCKIPQFWAKSINLDSPSYFSYPEVTKNSYYVLFLKASQKKGIRSWTICDNWTMCDINLYFMHYLYVVIVFFSTSLYKSAFSTYSFGKIGYFLSVFWYLCFYIFVF